MKLHNWNIEIIRDQIVIQSLYVYPGEADKLISLLSFARGMSELNLLPEDIGDPPFRIAFENGGELRVSRTDTPKIAEFNTKFRDIDLAIDTIIQSRKMAIDSHTLNASPLLTGQGFSRTDHDGL
mgnify:CR=1 FL=1